ncbi:DUF2256 domain-containing protein [Marinobacter nauticus]
MSHKKPHLPSKQCPVCLRPFTWRKKWARDWASVRYCSQRCRRSRPAHRFSPEPATRSPCRGR